MVLFYCFQIYWFLLNLWTLYEGETRSNQPYLFLVEIHPFLFRCNCLPLVGRTSTNGVQVPKQGAAYWFSGWHLLIAKRFWNPKCLCIPKRSYTVVKTLTCEKPNACAISSTWICPSEYTRSQTLYIFYRRWHFVGCPDPAYLKDVLPYLDPLPRM